LIAERSASPREALQRALPFPGADGRCTYAPLGHLGDRSFATISSTGRIATYGWPGSTRPATRSGRSLRRPRFIEQVGRDHPPSAAGFVLVVGEPRRWSHRPADRSRRTLSGLLCVVPMARISARSAPGHRGIWHGAAHDVGGPARPVDGADRRHTDEALWPRVSTWVLIDRVHPKRSEPVDAPVHRGSINVI
jgi:hypothetical protein